MTQLSTVRVPGGFTEKTARVNALSGAVGPALAGCAGLARDAPRGAVVKGFIAASSH